MRVGSLFSGIGGLDLGLERAGMSVVWQCEADPYCRAVLRKHWPDVPCYPDVRELTDADRVDLICGGFPCQPVSQAGRRLAQADDRWLWPEFARIVRLLRPRYVLVENVPGLLNRGMGDVLGDLAESGYDAEWDCIPAASVGAPHLRYRVFIVAHLQANASRPDANGFGPHRASVYEHGEAELRDEQERQLGSLGEDVADTEGECGQLRQAEGRRSRRPAGGGDVGHAASEPARGVAGHSRQEQGWMPEPRGRRGSDGGQWATEPDVGRVAHGVPSGLDGVVDEATSDQEARAEGRPEDDHMREVRGDRTATASSPGLRPTGEGRDPLSALSRRDREGGRDVGSRPKAGEDMRCLWHDVYPLQPQPGEVLLEGLSERAWEAQRAEAMGNPWAYEPGVPRVAKGVPDRVARLRALGNAVVPQVAEWIGRRIMTAGVHDEQEPQ